MHRHTRNTREEEERHHKRVSFFFSMRSSSIPYVLCYLGNVVVYSGRHKKFSYKDDSEQQLQYWYNRSGKDSKIQRFKKQRERHRRRT